MSFPFAGIREIRGPLLSGLRKMDPKNSEANARSSASRPLGASALRGVGFAFRRCFLPTRQPPEGGTPNPEALRLTGVQLSDPGPLLIRWQPRIVLAVILSVVLLKFFLIANQEIVTELHDALNYVTQADRLGVNFGLGSTGYTVWLAACKALSVPQRIAIELLWLASAAFLCLQIFPGGRKRWALVAVFAAAVFAPQTFHLFDRALTDGYFICLTALLLGLSIRVFRGDGLRRRLPALIGMGAVLGLMAITRNEGVLLLAFLAAWALLLGLYDAWGGVRPMRKILAGVAGALAVAGLFASILPGAVVLFNGWRYGVRTLSFVEMPSHMRLLKALAQIETGERNSRFVPISRRAREIAYAQSPTLAAFAPEVEDPGTSFQKESLAAIGRPGEVGAGWIWHVFNSAAGPLGLAFPRDLDATYRQAIREIEKGFQAGSYKRRFVPHPFLGGDASAWLPYLGAGFSHAVQCVLTPSERRGEADLSAADRSLFDRVCLRRTSLTQRTACVRGWAFSTDANHPITSVSTKTPPRPDNGVSVNLPRRGLRSPAPHDQVPVPPRPGFEAFASIKNEGDWFKLAFFSGPEWVGEIGEFDHDKSYTISGKYGDIVVGLDAIETNGFRSASPLRESAKRILLKAAASPAVWIAGMVAGCLALGVLVIFRKREASRLWIVSAGVLLIWSVIRLGFYSLISAAAWPAEPRYLQNTAIFGMLAVVILIVGAADCLANLAITSREARDGGSGASS